MKDSTKPNKPAAQDAPVPAQRIDSLQAVRALAFLGILSYHCGTSVLGAAGVSVFLVLSGFLMVYAYSERTLLCSLRACVSFSVRKIKKLYPLHIVMLFVSLAVTLLAKAVLENVPLTARSVLPYLRFFPIDALLMQAWVPSDTYYFSLNGVAWYLSVCLFLYAVFPRILRRMRRDAFSVRRAVIAAVLIYALQCALGLAAGALAVSRSYTFDRWFTYICPLFRLGDFGIGCCLGYLFLHRKSALRVLPATLLELAAFAVIAAAAVIFARRPFLLGDEFFRYTQLQTPGSVLLIWSFAAGGGILSKLLTNKPVLFLGKISPYGFLIHQSVVVIPVLLFRTVWGTMPNRWIATILTLGLTVVLSLLYMQAEQRIQNKRKRRQA